MVKAKGTLPTSRSTELGPLRPSLGRLCLGSGFPHVLRLRRGFGRLHRLWLVHRVLGWRPSIHLAVRLSVHVQSGASAAMMARARRSSSLEEASMPPPPRANAALGRPSDVVHWGATPTRLRDTATDGLSAVLLPGTRPQRPPRAFTTLVPRPEVVASGALPPGTKRINTLQLGHVTRSTLQPRIDGARSGHLPPFPDPHFRLSDSLSPVIGTREEWPGRPAGAFSRPSSDDGPGAKGEPSAQLVFRSSPGVGAEQLPVAPLIQTRAGEGSQPDAAPQGRPSPRHSLAASCAFHLAAAAPIGSRRTKPSAVMAPEFFLSSFRSRILPRTTAYATTADIPTTHVHPGETRRREAVPPPSPLSGPNLRHLALAVQEELAKPTSGRGKPSGAKPSTAVAASGSQETTATARPEPASPPPIDLHALTDSVYRLLESRIKIERERRGILR